MTADATAPEAPTPAVAAATSSGPTEDERWMAAAIAEGRRGHPSPNPHVGAALVKDGALLTVAHHETAGTAHAEYAALAAAKEAARGGTLYVTLEPCNHTGRTPPCTDAILASGVARVVYGCEDPNPHVAGGGAERLRAAGVEVVGGVLRDEARLLIAPWSKYVTQGLPYVSLKLALSLDGRIATRNGSSRWITGEVARARVHGLRAKHDAVGIGIGTALADDPRLTVRDAEGTSPVRVIFDTRLRLPLASRLVASAADVPTWIIASTDASPSAEEQLTTRGVEILRVAASAEGRIEPLPALRVLAARGIVTLMVEGGAELAGSLLANQLADELHAFLAPVLLGPRGRPGAVDWAGPTTPAEAPRIGEPRWEMCGNDAYVHGPLVYPERA